MTTSYIANYLSEDKIKPFFLFISNLIVIIYNHFGKFYLERRLAYYFNTKN